MNAPLTIALLITTSPFGLHAATPTLTFASAQPLMAGGVAINLGNHAAPRLVDWNSDGVLDLLVAGGDGYIWLFSQNQATNSTNFLAGVKVTASGSGIRVGNGYTDASFDDIDGDGKPDLIATGNDNRIRYYRNTGNLAVPSFSNFTVVPGSAGQFVMPSNVRAGIDVADWDGDGKLDLLTGDFDGYVTWYRNTGTATVPIFGAPGVRLKRDGSTIQEAYNTHPRVFDFNQDGIPDLTFGINWGYFKLLINTQGLATTNFPSDYLLRDTDGAVLDIRAFNNDDSIPDFADLTGDGVVDVISGGLNGKLFVMRGVSYATTLQSIEAIMAAHTTDLGTALNASSNLRDTLFGYHRSLRNLAIGGLLPTADRLVIRDWYRDHIARYPQYLTKRQLNQATDAYVPYLAGQVWTNLFESMPDTLAHRLATANAAGFSGKHISLLVDLGILYIENSRSTPASQQVLYDIAASIPPSLQIVETVTQNDFLVTPTGGSMDIESRKGVNVFAQVGDYSEGFPSDVPQTLIDGFSVVVAHELNHNVDVVAERIYPWYKDREYDLLEQASPPHLIFKNHNTVGFDLDLPATQANFLANGYWDGFTANWSAAYDAYWDTGPGTGFDRHWLRDNLKFCIDAPQEAFATLSNQYFASSDVMLRLAISRWKRGIPHGIDQFLFFADVYALGSNQTFFYRVNTAAQVTRTVIPIQRDTLGHISGLTTATAHYDFILDNEGNVLNFSESAPPTEPSGSSITSDLSTVSVPKGIPIPRFTITTNFGANSFAAKGLPKGLKLNKKNGVISGKPKKPGTYTVTLTAKKMTGKKVEQQATATKVVIVYQGKS